MSGYLDPGYGGGYDPYEEERRRREEAEAAARAQAEAEAAAARSAPQVGYDPGPYDGGYEEPAPAPQYPGYDPGQYDDPLPAADVATGQAAAQQAGYAAPQYPGYDPGYYEPEPEPEADPFALTWAAPQVGYDPGQYDDPIYPEVNPFELNQTGWRGGIAEQVTDDPMGGFDERYVDPFGNAYNWDPTARSTPLGILNNVEGFYADEQGNPTGEAAYNPFMSGIAEGQLDQYFNYYDQNGNYIHAPGVLDDALQESRNAAYTQQQAQGYSDWYANELHQQDVGWQRSQATRYFNQRQADRDFIQDQYGTYTPDDQAFVSQEDTPNRAIWGQEARDREDPFSQQQRFGVETQQQTAEFDRLLAEYRRRAIGGNVAGFADEFGLEPWELGLIESANWDRNSRQGALESWLSARGLDPRTHNQTLEVERGGFRPELYQSWMAPVASSAQALDQITNRMVGRDEDAPGLATALLRVVNAPSDVVKYGIVAYRLLEGQATAGDGQVVIADLSPAGIKRAVDEYLASHPDEDFELDLSLSLVDWSFLPAVGRYARGRAPEFGAIDTRGIGATVDLPEGVRYPSSSALPETGGGYGPGGVVRGGRDPRVSRPGAPGGAPDLGRPDLGGGQAGAPPARPSRYLDNDFGGYGSSSSRPLSQPDQPVPVMPRAVREPVAVPPTARGPENPARSGAPREDVLPGDYDWRPGSAGVADDPYAGYSPRSATVRDTSPVSAADRYDIPGISSDVRLLVDDLTGNPDYGDLFVGDEGRARARRVGRAVGEYVDATVKGDGNRAGRAFGKIPGQVMRDVQDLLVEGHGVDLPDRNVGVPPRRDRVEVERRGDEAAYYRSGKGASTGPNMAYNPERTAARGARQGPALGYSPAAERGVRTGYEQGPSRVTDRELRRAIEILDGDRRPTASRGQAGERVVVPQRGTMSWARSVASEIPYMPRERVARVALQMRRDLPSMSLDDARRVLSDVDYRGTGVRPEYDQAVEVPRAMVAWEPDRAPEGVWRDELGRWNGSERDAWTPEELGEGFDPSAGREGVPVPGQKSLPGMGPRGEDFIRHNAPVREAGYRRLEDVERDLLAAREHYDETVATYGAQAAMAREGAESLGVWKGGSYDRGGHYQSGVLAGKRDKRLSADRQAYKATAQEAIDRVAEAAREVNRLEAEYARLAESDPRVARRLDEQFDLPEPDDIDTPLGGEGFGPGLRPRDLGDSGVMPEYSRPQGKAPAAEPSAVRRDEALLRGYEQAIGTKGRVASHWFENLSEGDLEFASRKAKQFLKQHGNSLAAVVPAGLASQEDDPDLRAFYLTAAAGLGVAGAIGLRKAWLKEAKKYSGLESYMSPRLRRFYRLDTQRYDIATVLSQDLVHQIQGAKLGVGPGQHKTIAALKNYVKTGSFKNMLPAMTPGSQLRAQNVRSVMPLVAKKLGEQIPPLVLSSFSQHELMAKLHVAIESILEESIGVSKRGPLVAGPEFVRNVSANVLLKYNPLFMIKNVRNGWLEQLGARTFDKLGAQLTGQDRELIRIAHNADNSGVLGPLYLDQQIFQEIQRKTGKGVKESALDRYNPIMKFTGDQEVVRKRNIYQRETDNYLTTAMAEELGLEDGFLKITRKVNVGGERLETGASGRLKSLPDPLKQTLLGAKTKADVGAALRAFKLPVAQRKDILAIFSSHQQDAGEHALSWTRGRMRDYSRRTNLDTALSVVYPFHFWQTRGVAWNAMMASKSPAAAIGFAALSLWVMEENKNLPLADKIGVAVPAKWALDQLPDNAFTRHMREALDWMQNASGDDQELHIGPLNWVAETAVNALKGLDPDNLRNLIDVTDPVNMALAAEKLLGWKGRSAAWNIPEGVLRARQNQLPAWLRDWLNAGDESYTGFDKGDYNPSFAGGLGQVARGAAEFAGAGKVPRAINEFVYGSADGRGERRAIYAIQKQYGISEEEARKRYYAQGAAKGALANSGAKPVQWRYTGDEEDPGESPVKFRGPQPMRGDSPSEWNAGQRQQMKAVANANNQKRNEFFRDYGNAPQGDGSSAYWTAYNTQVMGDSPSESGRGRTQQQAARNERSTFMRETNDYIQRAVDQLIAEGKAENRSQAYGMPLPGLGGETAYHFWLENDPNYDPMKYTKTGEEHQRGSTGMGGGMYAGIASAASTDRDELAHQAAAIWDEYFDRKLTDPRGASAWLNEQYGDSGMTRAEFAQAYKKDEGLANLTGVGTIPIPATSSRAPAGSRTTSATGTGRTGGSSTTTRGSAPKSQPGLAGSGSIPSRSTGTGPKTEYGRQVASFFAEHGQPPPKGTPEADEYWKRNGSAWREQFGGSGSSGAGASGSSTSRGGSASSGSGRPRPGTPSASGRGSESNPFQRWLERERPDLAAKYAAGRV